MGIADGARSASPTSDVVRHRRLASDLSGALGLSAAATAAVVAAVQPRLRHLTYASPALDREDFWMVAWETAWRGQVVGWDGPQLARQLARALNQLLWDDARAQDGRYQLLRVCRGCGVEIGYVRGARRYCSACGDRRVRQRTYNRKSYARHAQRCLGCGVLVGLGHGAKRCDACASPFAKQSRRSRKHRRAVAA